MVALSVARAGVGPRHRLWLVAACAVVLLGSIPRLLLGGTGERSAAWLAVVIEACVCGAVWLLVSPRASFLSVLLAVVAFELAAIEPRGAPPYDDRQALYRTDQVMTLQASGAGAWLPVWVEPRFAGATPRFGLTVSGMPVACPWQGGVQRVGLPVRGAGEVRVQLTGAPGRDGDYLIVYTAVGQAGVPLQSDTDGFSACAPVAGQRGGRKGLAEAAPPL